MDITITNLKLLDAPPLSEAIDLVNDVFHRVNRVLPEDQSLLTISPERPAREAIALMKEHGYSQLPVMNADGSVLGVFSYRSFASISAFENIDDIKRDKYAPGDFPVDEYLEKFQFAKVDDELQSVFSSIDKDNGILVWPPPEKIVHVE